MTLRVLALLAIGLAVSSPAEAQRLGRIEGTTTNVDAYRYYVRPGEATVQVRVLGTVREPGLYELSDGTDLGTLLALTGGPNLDPREAREVRSVMIELYRPGPEGPNLVYEATLDRAVENMGTSPPLRDGDVLYVDVVTRTLFTWRDALSVLGAVAAVVYTVDRVITE